MKKLLPITAVARMVPKIVVANESETGVQIRPIKFSNGKSLCWDICRYFFYLKVVRSRVKLRSEKKTKPVPIEIVPIVVQRASSLLIMINGKYKEETFVLERRL